MPSSAVQRVAVVTGAGSGIGRALALKLAALDYSVALADVNEAGLQETQKLLRWPAQSAAPSSAADNGDAASARVLLQVLDVSRREDVVAFSERVMSRWGVPDLVINNAGVAVSQHVAQLTRKDFDWIMGINFDGVVSGTLAFLPAMQEANRGVIVNISSIFGVIGLPSQAAYSASKFAVRGFSESLHHELQQCGSNVRCLVVLPGGVATNIARSARIYVDPEGGVDVKAAHARFDSVARTTPTQAAETILNAVHRGASGTLLVGPDAYALYALQRCLPRHYFCVLNALSRASRMVEPYVTRVLNWWHGGKPAEKLH